MANKTAYVCKSCGHKEFRWFGKCSECGNWNTAEEVQETTATDAAVKNVKHTRSSVIQPVSLGQIPDTHIVKIPTNISEFDRVTDGGIVPGSFTLLGGAPGIGKSTLLLQILGGLKVPCLYITAEESLQQLKIHAKRLGAVSGNILFAAENNLENIKEIIAQHKPAVAVIDSIQTIYSETVAASPGGVAQIKECATHLMYLAKPLNCSIIITGHVTKDDNIAGPKILEHMVDTVLYFENDIAGGYRILQCTKNRFGAIDEVGIFEMTDHGLNSITDINKIFMSSKENKIGSAIVPILEGNRVIPVEIQALVQASTFGYPVRQLANVDFYNTSMLIAALEKHLKLSLSQQHIYINVVGGIKVKEPAADLAICAAIFSSFKNVPIPTNSYFIGEVDLLGEVRNVSKLLQRVNEMEGLGFDKGYIPNVKNQITGTKISVLQGFFNIIK